MASKAIFSNFFRTIIAKMMVNSQMNRQVIEWESGIQITSIGTFVSSGDGIYISANIGRCGTIQPLHSSGVRSDGVVNWIFVEKKKPSDLNLYIFLSGQSDWVDDVPPVPSLDSISSQTILNGMIALKKITQNDIRICVDRVVWKRYNVYETYTDGSQQRKPYFVMNRYNDVYLCLNNADGTGSITEPTSKNVNALNYSDGYTWKYIYSVSDLDMTYFMTSKFIPISIDQIVQQTEPSIMSVSRFDMIGKTGDMIFNDINETIIGTGSGLLVTYPKTRDNQVKFIRVEKPGTGFTEQPLLTVNERGSPGLGAFATASIIDGQISGITVTSSGSNYSYANAYVVGDGTGAVLKCELDMKQIVSISVESGGSGYTRADIHIVPGENSFIARGVLAPVMGHGYNILKDMEASTVLISVPIPSNSYFDSSSFRQAGIINNCIDNDGNNFTEIEYIGKGHQRYDDLAGALKKHDGVSGDILMIENFDEVVREEGLEERVKFIINF